MALYINCVICLEVIGARDDIMSLACGHLYHGTCIQEWLDTCKDCPTCRVPTSNRRLRKIYLPEADGPNHEKKIGELKQELAKTQEKLYIANAKVASFEYERDQRQKREKDTFDKMMEEVMSSMKLAAKNLSINQDPDKKTAGYNNNTQTAKLNRKSPFLAALQNSPVRRDVNGILESANRTSPVLNIISPIRVGSVEGGSTHPSQGQRYRSTLKIAKVCDRLDMNDVHLVYRDAHFKQINSFKLFETFFLPQVKAANQGKPRASILELLSAKWRHFKALGDERRQIFCVPEWSSTLSQANRTEPRGGSDRRHDSDHQSSPCQRSAKRLRLIDYLSSGL
eukprot:TRINITY_DN5275_c0_g1_i6.p1 TRINITY_DN5275_c0_g1~~TRINITY_DN5275_c0_g1_i6.p1  ORF type:complete len:339 (-),score=39.62 TRINITY_DN5275_c0_g1_i6:254-1270(-)